MKVTYTKAFLDLVHSLSSFNKETTFFNEDGKVKIRKKGTMAIFASLEAAQENFLFEGDELAFSDYGTFHSQIGIFKDPNIEQIDNKMILSKGNTKINYLLSDPKNIEKSSYKKLKFGPSKLQFVIDNSEFDNISKLLKNVTVENVRFTFEGDYVTLMFFKADYDNSFEVKIKLETPYDGTEVLELKSDFFKLAPSYPYLVDIDETNIFKFTFKNDVYALDFYTKTRNDG